MFFLRQIRLCLWLLCGWGLVSPAFALDRVTLQLKWHHQFQFAGYFAAPPLGHDRGAGFGGDIRAADVRANPVEESLAGRAQFGASTQAGP